MGRSADSAAVGHTFNQVLGNEALHLSSLRKLDEHAWEITRATYFHQVALNGIRGELQQPGLIVTDDIIATVSGFLCYAV